MKKLLELEERLIKAKEDLVKQGAMADAITAGITRPAPTPQDTTSILGFGKNEKEEEVEEEIKEEIDEHNEKKHGEPKKEDSAFKTEMIKFDANGQWSMKKGGDTSDKIQRSSPGARQPAYVRGVFGEKAKTAKVVDTAVSPEEQVKAKKDLAANKKAKFETEAKARRAEYRKTGELK